MQTGSSLAVIGSVAGGDRDGGTFPHAKECKWIFSHIFVLKEPRFITQLPT